MTISLKKPAILLLTLLVLIFSALGVTPAHATWVFNNKTTVEGLGNNFVNGVFVNGSSVYAATNGGLSISTNGGTSFINKTDSTGLGNNTVNGVFESGGTIYAATNSGLSISTDGGTSFVNRRVIPNGLGSNTVFGVFVSGGTIYAATDGGLSISTNGGTSFINKTTVDGLGTNKVNGVFVNGTTVYAATDGGLSISTDSGATFPSNKTTADGMGSNTVNVVFESAGTIYAATDDGLAISTNGGTSFSNKTDTNGLGNNLVKGVSASGSAVYAATNGGLSISIDGGNSFSNKTTANGLGSNLVKKVFVSGSTVYAATTGGLSIGADTDITAPTVNSFTATTPVGNFNIPITAFTASDDFAVTGYLITESATPPASGAVGWTVSAPTTYVVTGNGSYTLYPWAKDAVGQVSAVYGSPASVLVQDNTAPETSINSQPASLDGDNTPSFTFSGNDGSGSGVASFMCKMDAGSYAACSSPFTSSALSDGSHTFSVYAIDNASNADATPASYTWTIDTLAPTVSSIVRVGSSPTSAVSVGFTVTFSESVTGVGIGDFSLTTSGITGAGVSGVTGSGSVYTVTVNTGSGNGTIRLDVPVSASITDAAANALSGLPFTTGEIYTVDKNISYLPSPWSGGISISSDKNVVAVGRPHIGAEVMTYDGFSSGSTTSYIPMLFKDAFGGSYDSAFYIQNVHASNTANIAIKFYDSAGALSCTVNDTILPLASKGYWVPGQSCLTTGWVGGVVVSSDQPIVAVGRPHIGTEVMTYNGFTSGSTTSYIPMLFKDAFAGGSYDAAFYIQNVHATNPASITIKYFDSAGALSCSVNDTIAPLASKGYWVPGQSCLPVGWVGGVVVTSDQPIVGVGRPHIGSQVTTYNGFAGGVNSSYIPMLFKDAFGGSYDAAYYIQNVHATNPASLTIKYYDSAGNLTCSVNDTLLPLASRGYWVPAESCLPAGWIGGVVVTSSQPIVAVGRPHIAEQVTTYDGFTSGSTTSYIPMLFKDAFGGSYDSALYIQNTEASAAVVTVKFYDSTGALTCTRNDSIPALSTVGLWLPATTCSE